MQRHESKHVAEKYHDPDALLRVAHAVMDEYGEQLIRELIEDDKINNARECLLEAVDAEYMSGAISEEVAREMYETIGFSPEEASRIRQSDVAPWSRHPSQ